MDIKSPTRTTMMRLIPPLAIWAIGRVFEIPSVKGSVMEIDGYAYKRKHEAVRSLRRGVKNARSNIAWLAAGAAVIVIGIGLVARATRGK
jgi:hypothetical protein